MTIPFVETRRVPRENIETLTGDHSVGILNAAPGESIRGDVRIDVQRLRRAILAFEEEFDQNIAEVAIAKEEGSDGIPVLALVPEGGSDRGIVLASRISEESDSCYTGADELVERDGGEEA